MNSTVSSLWFYKEIGQFKDVTLPADNIDSALFYIGDPQNLCIVEIQGGVAIEVVTPRIVDTSSAEFRKAISHEITPKYKDGMHIFDYVLGVHVMDVTYIGDYPELNWEVFTYSPNKIYDMSFIVIITSDFSFDYGVAYTHSYLPRLMYLASCRNRHFLRDDNVTKEGLYATQALTLLLEGMHPVPLEVLYLNKEAVSPKKTFNLLERSTNRLKEILSAEPEINLYDGAMKATALSGIKRKDLKRLQEDSSRYELLFEQHSEVGEIVSMELYFGVLYARLKHMKTDRKSLLRDIRRVFSIPKYIPIEIVFDH